MANGYGYVTKGVGGLYQVRLLSAQSDLIPKPYVRQPLDEQTVSARARNFRKDGGLYVGDLVEVTYDRSSYLQQGNSFLPDPNGTPVTISRVLPRRSALIRPPMANLDYLFVTLTPANPEPDLETIDKLTCIAVFNRIRPVIIINKCDVDPKRANELESVYRAVGFPVFRTVGAEGTGVRELLDWLSPRLPRKLAAFAGASGVGKSTLLGKLFPNLSFETGNLSERISRGKNTTRHVELCPLDDSPDTGYLADTPGFTMLDFEQFDFFGLEDLPSTFPEFDRFQGHCRYADCTHTKEEDCAVRNAVREGLIPASRHQTYLSLYEILKKKPRWKTR